MDLNFEPVGVFPELEMNGRMGKETVEKVVWGLDGGLAMGMGRKIGEFGQSCP